MSLILFLECGRLSASSVLSGLTVLTSHMTVILISAYTDASSLPILQKPM